MNNISYIKNLVVSEFNLEKLDTSRPQMMNGEEVQINSYCFFHLQHQKVVPVQSLIIGIIETTEKIKGIILLPDIAEKSIALDLSAEYSNLSQYLDQMCLFPIRREDWIHASEILSCHIVWGSSALYGDLMIKPFDREDESLNQLWNHIFALIKQINKHYQNSNLEQYITYWQEGKK